MKPGVYTSIGLGIILKLLPPKDLHKSNRKFQSQIARPNVEAMEAGYDMVETKYELGQFKDESIILNGSEAWLGCHSSRVRFTADTP